MNDYDQSRLLSLKAHQKELRSQAKILKLKIAEAKKTPRSGLQALQFNKIVLDGRLKEVKRNIEELTK